MGMMFAQKLSISPTSLMIRYRGILTAVATNIMERVFILKIALRPRKRFFESAYAAAIAMIMPIKTTAAVETMLLNKYMDKGKIVSSDASNSFLKLSSVGRRVMNFGG